MLRGKEKSYLRSMAMTMEPIFQIGKDGVGSQMIAELDAALEARELIKIKILKNSAAEKEETGKELAQALHSELVQIIGRCIVLYRKSTKKPKIELPR